MAGDWLSARRTEVAAERILDAAAELFTRYDVATVGMLDIARAAGCSRATLYRYFENRDALYTAYVHREAQQLYRRLGEQLAEVTDPQQRLVEGVLGAVRSVRENPTLSAWFAVGQRPIGGEMAERSQMVAAMAEAFVASLDPSAEAVEQRARWLVRVITSLLVFPGRDEADERAMLTEFVVPTCSARNSPAGAKR